MHTLEWFEVPDAILGIPGWSLHVGVTYVTEECDAPTVKIHRVKLNTGQRDIELQLDEIPYWEIESAVSEMIEDRDLRTAKALAEGK